MGRVIADAALKVYAPAAETDLSGGVVAITRECRGVGRVSFQPVFAGYTSVTVKLQATLDGTNWFDVPSATTDTSGAIVSAALLGSGGPYAKYRVHVTGTLSAGTDTFELWVQEAPAA